MLFDTQESDVEQGWGVVEGEGGETAGFRKPEAKGEGEKDDGEGGKVIWEAGVGLSFK